MRAILISFWLLSVSVYGQNAREIIDRYLDTVSNGNIDNWNKIKSLYLESEVYYSQNDFDPNVDFLRKDDPHYHKSYKILPYHHKTEIYQDSNFLNLLSEFYFLKDRTIIQLGNLPPMIKDPPARDEFISSLLPVQIHRLVNKSAEIELIARKEFSIEGVACYEIKITANGRNYFLFINTDTFLLEFWNGREDEDTSFLTRYLNYMKVGEFLIPMSEYAIRNGVVYFWDNTRKIEINPMIDPEIFNYPRKR